MMTEFYLDVLSRTARSKGKGWAVAVVIADRPRFMTTRYLPAWNIT